MAIQLWEQKILIVDGKIAVSEDCCCDTEPPEPDLCAVCDVCMTAYANIQGIGGWLQELYLSYNTCYSQYNKTKVAFNTTGGISNQYWITLNVYYVYGSLYVRVDIANYSVTPYVYYTGYYNVHDLAEPVDCTDISSSFTVSCYKTGWSVDYLDVDIQLQSTKPICSAAISAGPAAGNRVIVYNLPTLKDASEVNTCGAPYALTLTRTGGSGTWESDDQSITVRIIFYAATCSYRLIAGCTWDPSAYAWWDKADCGGPSGVYKFLQATSPNTYADITVV